MAFFNDRNIENGMVLGRNYKYREEDYDDPKFYCDCCSTPIYEGDIYFNILDNRMCEECVKDCEEKA